MNVTDRLIIQVFLLLLSYSLHQLLLVKWLFDAYNYPYLVNSFLFSLIFE